MQWQINSTALLKMKLMPVPTTVIKIHFHIRMSVSNRFDYNHSSTLFQHMAWLALSCIGHFPNHTKALINRDQKYCSFALHLLLLLLSHHITWDEKKICTLNGIYSSTTTAVIIVECKPRVSYIHHNGIAFHSLDIFLIIKSHHYDFLQRHKQVS